MTYSSYFRRKVLSVRKKEGLTIAAVATRWVKNPEPKLTRNKPATKIDMDALVQDNASFHKRADTLEMIEKAGHFDIYSKISFCVLFLGN